MPKQAKMKQVYVLILLLMVQFQLRAGPQWHVDETLMNHIIIIQHTCSISSNAGSLQQGDYIGVFYDSLGILACAGYCTYSSNQNMHITAWGADQGLDGFQNGEEFTFKVYYMSTGVELACDVSYDISFPNGDSYTPNGLSVLSAISVIDLAVEAGEKAKVCQNGNLTLSGVPYGLYPPYQYSWENPSGASFATGSETTFNCSEQGYYTIHISDNLGHTSSDQVYVETVQNPTLDLGPDVPLSDNDGVELSASGYVSYLWSNGENDSSINVVQPTFYSLTVANSFGCTANDSLEVFGPNWTYTKTGFNHILVVPYEAVLTINAQHLDNNDFIGVFYEKDGLQKCAGFAKIDTTQSFHIAAWGTNADLEGFAANEAFKFRIWKRDGSIELKASATYDNSIMFPNDEQYTTNGLSGLSTLTALPLGVELGGNITCCKGDTVVLHPRVLSTNFDYNLEISNGLTSIALDSCYYEFIADGNVNFQIEASDAASNSDNDNISVTVNNLPIPDLGEDTILNPYQSVDLDPGYFSSYQWNTGDSSNHIITSQNGQYIVTVTDQNNCSEDDTVRVITPPWQVCQTLPNHTIIVLNNCNFNFSNFSIERGDFLGVFYDSLGLDVCAGYVPYAEDVDFHISAWGAFEDLSGFISNEEFKWRLWKSSTCSEYSLEATYSTTFPFTEMGHYQTNGVSGVDAFTIDNYYIDAGIDRTICEGDTVQLQPKILADATIQSLRFGNDPQALTDIPYFSFFTPTVSGIYYLALVDNNGDQHTDQFNITIESPPQPNLGSDTTLKIGNSIALNPGNYTDYFWNDGSQGSSFLVDHAGTYSVTVTNSHNCKGSDTVKVFQPNWDYQPTDNSHIIIVPDTFTLSDNPNLLSHGDFLGVFYDSAGTLKCGGQMAYIQGQSNHITAWGKTSTEDDGFTSGEEFTLLLWDKETDSVYELLPVYDHQFMNDSLYSVNGLSCLRNAFPVCPSLNIEGDTTVCDGTNLSLSVQTGTCPYPISYQWYFNGIPLLTENQQLLSLQNVQTSFSGIYKCSVSIKGKAYYTNQVKVEVLVSPIVYLHPVNQHACVDDQVLLTIDATDHFAFRWQKFNGSGFSDLYDGLMFQNANTKTLLIQNISEINNGNLFRCKVSGCGQDVYSDQAELSVGSCLSLCGDINQNSTFNYDTIKVNCDTKILDGSNVELSPGTLVEFQGDFSLTIEGSLRALGTEEDPISFAAKDGISGWNGIVINNSSVGNGVNGAMNNNDSTRFLNCVIKDCFSSQITTEKGTVLTVNSFGKVEFESTRFVMNGSRFNNLFRIENCDILFSHCVIANNQSERGGIIYTNNFDGLIVNSTISHNTVGSNSTMIIENSDCNILNSNIVNNATAEQNPAIRMLNSSPQIINTIIWNNGSDPEREMLRINGNPSILYSLYPTEGGPGGTGNFSGNLVGHPGFRNATIQRGTLAFGNEFSLVNQELKANSACINSGSPGMQNYPLGKTDIEGYPRIQHDTVDIGAYEYSGETQTIWKGTDNNWQLAKNWTDGLPGARTKTIVDNANEHYPILTNTAQLKDLEIAPNSKCEISSSGYLSVTNTVLLKANDDGRANFIPHGEFHYNPDSLQIELYHQGSCWNYISSPVPNNDLSNFLGHYVKYWDGTSQNGAPSWNYVADPLYNFEIGRGYAFWAVSPETVSFQGSLNTGAITYSNLNDNLGDWHLLGNGYTSTVHLDDATGWYWGASVTRSVYRWNPNLNNGQGGYTTYNCQPGGTGVGVNGASAYLDPMQGFFVHTSASNWDLELNEDAMKFPTVGGAKSSLTEENTLRLTLSSGLTEDEAILRFKNDANLLFDSSYDAYKLSNSNIPQLSVLLPDSNLVCISTLPDSFSNYVIPLHISADLSDSLQISFTGFATFSPELEFFLEDQDNNVFQNLTNMSEYSFLHSINSDNYRLRIHINGVITETEKIPAPSSLYMIYSYGSDVYFNRNSKNDFSANYQIFNLDGKLITRGLIKDQFKVVPLNVSNGFYLVRLASRTDTQTSKVFIQN